jgi:hypothetical protein
VVVVVVVTVVVVVVVVVVASSSSSSSSSKRTNILNSTIKEQVIVFVCPSVCVYRSEDTLSSWDKTLKEIHALPALIT